MPNNLEVKTLTQKTDVDPVTDLVVAHDTIEEEAVLIAPRDAHKALGDRYSFGALSIDDYESDDDKKVAIQTALADNDQRTVRIGKGVWPVAELEIGNSTRLIGSGSKAVEDGRGTVLSLNDPEATCILKTKQIWVDGDPTIAVRDIVIENLTFDLGEVTTASAFLHDMTYDSAGMPTNDIVFRNVTFWASGVGQQALAWFKAGTGQSPYCEGITFENCRLIVGQDGRGIQIDTVNSLITIDQLTGIGTSGSTFIYGLEMGLLEIRNSTFECPAGTAMSDVISDRTIEGIANLTEGENLLTFSGGYDGSNNPLSLADVGHPVVHSALPDGTYIKSIGPYGFSAVLSQDATDDASDDDIDIKRYVRSTDMPYAAIHVVGERDEITIQTTADEALRNSYVFEGPYYAPVNLNNCRVQSPIRVLGVEGDNSVLNLNVTGGTFSHGTLNAEADCIINLVANGVNLLDNTAHGVDSPTVTVDEPRFEGEIDPDCIENVPIAFFNAGASGVTAPKPQFTMPMDVLEITADPDGTRGTFRIGNIHQGNATDNILPILELGSVDPIKRVFDSATALRCFRDSNTGLYYLRGRQEGARGVVIPDVFAYSPGATALVPTLGFIPVDPYSGSSFTLTPTGDCSIYFTRVVPGQPVTIKITTSGTTAYNINFGGGNVVSNGAVNTGTEDGMYLEVGFYAEDSVLKEQYRCGPIDPPFDIDNIPNVQLYCPIDENTDPTNLTDLSGNSRHMTPSSSTPPALNDLSHGRTELRWNGSTTNPLQTAGGTFSATHVFLAASYDNANFSGYDGLMSALNTVGMLVGGDGTNAFFNLSMSASYRINGVDHAESSMSGPMSGAVSVIEWSVPSPASLTNGFQLGSDRDFASRIWTGTVNGGIIIVNDASMTAANRRRCRKQIAYLATHGVA